MQAIWKYTLERAGQQVFSIPVDAEFLCVQMQDCHPRLWVRIPDSDAEDIARVIEIFGTGHEMDDADRSYIGTYQMFGGSLVFHVYERNSPV